jgi:hypothetical protein
MPRLPSRRFPHQLLIMRPVLIVGALVLASESDLAAQRKPLTSDPITRLTHQPTGVRYRADTAGNAARPYPVNGRTDFLPATGDFRLAWMGQDGKERQVVWQPPNKLTAVVEAIVTFDAVTRLYTYTYTAINEASSKQALQTIYLEGDDVQSGSRPAGWYSRALTDYLKTSLGVRSGWAWSDVSESKGIAPGVRRDSAGDFRVVSPEPPGIVRVFVSGYQRPMSSDEDLPDELHAAIDRAAWQLPRGVTIGPVRRNRIDVIEELNRIIEWVDVAEAQGWTRGRWPAGGDPLGLRRAKALAVAKDMSGATLLINKATDELRDGTPNELLPELKLLLLMRLDSVRHALAGSRD